MSSARPNVTFDRRPSADSDTSRPVKLHGGSRAGHTGHDGDLRNHPWVVQCEGTMCPERQRPAFLDAPQAVDSRSRSRPLSPNGVLGAITREYDAFWHRERLGI